MMRAAGGLSLTQLSACMCCHGVQMIIMGLIVGSLFFNVPPDRSGVRTLLGGEFVRVLCGYAVQLQ